MNSNELQAQFNLLLCKECFKTFQYKSKLDRHLLVHTQIKKHVCKFCNAAFTLLYNLEVHMRIHTGSKPYKCHYEGCGKSFTQSNNLTVHLKLHRPIIYNFNSLIRRQLNKTIKIEAEDDNLTITSEGDLPNPFEF